MHADGIGTAGRPEAAAWPEDPILARLIGRADSSDFSLRIGLEDDEGARQRFAAEPDGAGHLGEPPVAATARRSEQGHEATGDDPSRPAYGKTAAGRRGRETPRPPATDR